MVRIYNPVLNIYNYNLYIIKYITFQINMKYFLGVNEGKSITKVFARRNKTAPLDSEQLTPECGSLSQNLTPSIEILAGEKSTQTITILNPLDLNINHSESYTSTKLIRPYTAPERLRLSNDMIINIPGQVPQ